MPSLFNSIWGIPVMLDHSTNLPVPLSVTSGGDACSVIFGQSLTCALGLADPRLTRHFMFTLQQPVQVQTGTVTSLKYHLRLYVYKPLGAEVSIQLKTASQMQQLHFGPAVAADDSLLLELLSPAVLVDGSYDVRLDVQLRRNAVAEEVMVTADTLDVGLV